MKNKLIFLVMLVCILALNLAFISCDNGSTSGNAPSTNGRLTLSGLEAYNGNYIAANGGTEYLYLIAAENANVVTYSIIGSKISNGSVTLKVWQYAGTNELLDYKGNNQNVKFNVEIYGNANISNTVAFTEVSVNFSNGVGNVVCNNILPAEKEFSITIKNNSIYSITAYGVKTEAGLVGPKYDIAYTSAGFDNIANYLRIEDYSTRINMPQINITAGETSNNLGPFKIVFRSDRANPSDVEVVINYLNGSTTKSSYWSLPEHPSHPHTGWSGYYSEELPSNITLVFDGKNMKKE
jgi:hypothetical protein